MARTQKDLPNKILHSDSVTKKKKKVDITWKWWSATPGWWVSLFMTKPQRRKAHLWEHEVSKAKIEDLDKLDTPSVGRKPHVYYY